MGGRSAMCKREGVLCAGGKEYYVWKGSSTVCRREGVSCVVGKE